MDTHQFYAYTAPDSELPHLFVDVAISPGTEGTFHVGIDMIPRVDLGANVAYMQELFLPLTQAQKDGMDVPGVMTADSVGPMHYALRSPWMFAAFVKDDSIAGCATVRDTYVDHWIKLLQDGVSPAVKDEVASQDLSGRDQRNRAALFSPRTNPVWNILGRMVGDEQATRMRDILGSQQI
jgi:hypothetical protein